MHAVSDMLNRNLIRGQIRPYLLPHLPADPAVLGAYCIAIAAAPQGKGGHIEAIRPGRAHAQAEELISGEIQGRKIGSEVLVHERIGEYVVPRRHRSMGGEDGGLMDLLEGLSVAHASFHLLPDPLQNSESGMALV